MKPLIASFSVDIDSVASHLRGYGFTKVSDDGAAYRLAVPRAIEVFNRAGVRGTFFLIAEEAIHHADIVKSIADSGHEVASHSMTHSVPFDWADPRLERSEIVHSKCLLSNISGREVVGFRAPSWDVSRDLLEKLADAGYRYDASAYPSWMMLLLRWSVARRSSRKWKPQFAAVRQGLFGNPLVHVVHSSRGFIAEIPIGTVPLLRLPHYQTLRFLVPGAVSFALSRLAKLRRGPLSYVFHAVDFLDAKRDRLDQRICRHPGMHLALDRKLRLAEASISELLRGRQSMSLAELAEVVLREHSMIADR